MAISFMAEFLRFGINGHLLEPTGTKFESQQLQLHNNGRTCNFPYSIK